MARVAATGPMQADAARRMRRTAQQLDQAHPETVAGGHVRDAARVLQRGGTEGAKRHLDAAMEVLTPRNLLRHGITDDDGHQAAKALMHQVHRHRLAVMDIEDARGRNDRLRQAARERRDAGPALPLAQRRASERQDRRDQATSDPGASTAGLLVAASNELTFAPAYLRESRSPRSGEWISGSAGSVFGRKVSKKEAAGFASLFETRGHVHGGMKAPTLKEQARHAGLRTKAQRAVYRKLRKKGHGHAYAVRLAGHFTPQMMTAAVGAFGGNAAAVELVGPKGYVHGWIRVAGLTAAQKAALLALVRMHRRMRSTDQYGQVRTPGANIERAALNVITTPARLVEKTLPRSKRQRRNAAPALTFSARTAMLERTPAPRGRPGGPGLYDVAGMGHTPYLQQIVKALIEKRGMPPGKAYAIARGAIRKWLRGGGHVHPEVRAAAGRAEAGELARQARAKASHGHSVTGLDVADALIELACEPIDLFNPYHAPPGSAAGGQFTTQQGAGQGKAKPGNVARRKAQLRTKIAGLRRQIAALEAQYRAATGGRHRGAAGGRAGKAGKAGAARAGKAGKSASSTPRKRGVPRHRMSAATIHSKIIALRAQLRADIAQLRAL